MGFTKQHQTLQGHTLTTSDSRGHGLLRKYSLSSVSSPSSSSSLPYLPDPSDKTLRRESDIASMKRVLGNLHIRTNTEHLRKGKTRKDETPFASSFQVRDPPLSVIIIGSGFAGFSAAIACARQGFQVTLLEKGSGLSPHGDLISFCPNANRILRRWGLDGLMWQRSCKGGWDLVKDKDGNTVDQLDMKEVARQHGSPMFQGHRAQYLGVFGVECRLLGVDIIPFTEVVDILDNVDSPACIAHDGRVFHADCILVADGCNSTLRTTVFGTPSKEATSGFSIHRAITKVTPEFLADPKCGHFIDGNVRVWLGPNSHVFFSPLDEGRQMSFSMTHRDINKAASSNWRDIKPMSDVVPFLSGWDPALLAAVSHFKTGLHWRLFHHEPIPTWLSKNGRIAFLGDAIHTYLPTSFQGASASVEDGATLGICLALAGGKSSNIKLALQTYEKLRQSKVLERAEAGLKQKRAWNTYYDTKDRSKLPILARKFFDEDAEAFAFENFQSIAQGVDKSFVLNPTTVSKTMELAGF